MFLITKICCSNTNTILSDDPEATLRKLPILTKNDIRQHFDTLKSDDLDRRKWKSRYFRAVLQANQFA